ncbi:Tat (twin-arginine translocation) pathway signal sequence [Mesorhizobium albiziae]|uniref:Tat (Twin-arginine translocation) pathway signal sequence n=1 Tax=Neomesorhizobium albiziae TaxID=335020 RepID=A0A1I4AHJ6_9HYPH|nr:L,D-transpeptidase [Mesorhizobium albiziae]GLS32873.1 L,D-transpeptidase [Mesorhizobium albiziae]SFK55854.1 Tat (twin-arginine translocation) pathway signal sequence [Mesorhizobium albiziae]
MSGISKPSVGFSRRQFLTVSGAVAASAALSACTTIREPAPEPIRQPIPQEPPLGGYEQMYASVVDEGYELPAIPVNKVEKRFLRQIVQDPTGEMPGTIVVDTQAHYLYLIRPGGEAIRYGVGLGRAGFAWQGRAVVQWKKKWPTWKVPDEMIARQPELEKYSVANGGMQPGLKNPLGSRALYIFQDGEDTLYRIHGSPEWWTIGKSVSSGCVRMINQDVMDLYNRVPNKTPILVY